MARNTPHVPNLTSLPLTPPPTQPPSIHSRWLSKCGVRPELNPWRSLRAADKHRLLHHVAETADDDKDPEGDYVVEHVVPRSFVAGVAPSPAEDDPIGWIEVTRHANSRRSNYPLYLWPDPDGMLALPNTTVLVDGELHYVPPVQQRARLARKWLFVRATYKDISPPSKAQSKRAASIVALAKHDRPHPAEIRVNRHYREKLGWANPLLESGADEWYRDPQWRALVMGWG